MRARRALRIGLGLLGLLWPARAAAQLSPPGLGPAETATWTAIGVRQDLDALRRRELMTYLGTGTIRQHDDVNPLGRPSIWVLNQELYDHFRTDLFYSIALSYRRQKQYEPVAPHAAADAPLKQELRLYGRFGRTFGLGRLKLTSAFRPELRGFFGAGLGGHEEPLELRFRLKTQVAWTVDLSGVHRVLASGEVLAAVARDREGAWSSLAYRESRLCLYYSISPKRAPLVVDVGYMNDVLGTGAALVDVHYLAVDIVWHSPLARPKS